MTTPTLGFICGSLRDGSINQKLQKALMARVKTKGAKAAKINLGTYDLPMYHGDLDAPKAVNSLVNRMKKMDGIVIVSPEYNGGLPPVLKNAIDWTSTVGTDQFTGPVYGIASCTPGPMSGIMCMRQIHYILTRVGCEVVPAQVGTGHATAAFDHKGNLIAEPSATLADKMIDQMLTRIAQKTRLAD